METEIEFSMLDQADFAGIDAYIKRHGLNDSSLAESRRAKVYNVNTSRGQAPPTEDGANNVTASQGQNGTAGGAQETELQKAERLQQEEEDDDEEDYVDEDYDEGSSDDEDYGENEGEEYDEDEEEEGDEDGHGYEDDEEPE
jgi:hypothetical protein